MSITLFFQHISKALIVTKALLTVKVIYLVCEIHQAVDWEPSIFIILASHHVA